MRKALLTAVAVMGTWTALGSAWADDVVVYSTGVDDDGRVLRAGVPDPHYDVLVTPSGQGIPANGDAVVAAAHFAYQSQNDPVGSVGSSWIGVAGDTNGFFLPGDYVFRTTFSLTGLLPSTARLTVAIAADDLVYDVLLNGQSLGIMRGGSRFNDPVPVTQGFRDGANTLDFVVRNGGSVPNPMGLRLVVRGTADPAVPVDTTPPSITGPATTPTLSYAGSSLVLSPALLGIAATDLVDGTVPVTLSPVVVGLGTHTITATASDAAGNSATATFSVRVADVTAPTLQGVAHARFEYAGQPVALVASSLEITATDLVDGSVPVVLSPASVGLGTHAVTASATDAAGNTASALFKVCVADTTTPALQGVSDAAFEYVGQAIALTASGLGISAQDVVDGAVPVALSPSSVGLGTHTVTASATDAAGNRRAATFTVRVADTTAPTLQGVANATFEYAGQPIALSAAALGITASDAADGAVAVALSRTSVGLGTHTVYACATDAAGNRATASFTVRVADTIAPTLSLSATPDTLNARDHEMVDVTITARALDAGDAAPRSRIVSVCSSEDGVRICGNSAADWRITGDLTLQLRAERSGGSGGRVYTITVDCVDASGNTTRGHVPVAVAHDNRR
jgi:hypothetical protein